MYWSARWSAISSPRGRGYLKSVAHTLLCAMTLTACFLHRNPEEIAPRRSTSRDSLLAIDAHRGDPAAVGPHFSSGAVYLRAGAPAVFGRESIAALLVPTAAAVVSQPVGGGLSLDRLSGYTFGIAV